jgi:hypothetical protein
MQSFIYDPRGALSAKVGIAARRVQSLDNLRLAVINNTKWNAAKLLNAVTERLKVDTRFAQVNFFKKETYTRNAAPALLEDIARSNDIALIAIGD